MQQRIPASPVENHNAKSERVLGLLFGVLIAMLSSSYFSIRYSVKLNKVGSAARSGGLTESPSNTLLEANAELHNLISRLREENTALKERIARSTSTSKSDTVDSKSLASHQRSFIYDIASPVAISQGMLLIVLTNLKKEPDLSPADLEKLQKAAKALERLVELVRKNQEYIRLSS